MRPVLFEVPLPRLSLPLGLTLGLFALLSVLVAAFGYRRRTPDLVLLGLIGLLAGAFGAIRYRGETFTPSVIPVMSYGFLLAVSLAAGWLLTLRLAERAGLSRDIAAHTYVVAAISGLVGARLLYVLANPSEIRSFSDLLGMGAGGLVAYGGFVGGALGALLTLKRLGTPFLSWADVAVPSVALGLGITRLGCYLHGCDFGRLLPAGGGWLATLGTFPHWPEGSRAGGGSPAFLEHVLSHGLSPTAPESLPVHPTQLYEAVVGLGLFGLAMAFHSRRRRTGELFAWVAFAYGACRFVLEFFRADPERGHFGPGLPGLAWVGLGFAVIAASGALAQIRRPADRRDGALLGALAVAAVAATLIARLTAFAAEPRVALSTSQWLGLATVVGAAVLLRRLATEAPPAAGAQLAVPAESSN